MEQDKKDVLVTKVIAVQDTIARVRDATVFLELAREQIDGEKSCRKEVIRRMDILIEVCCKDMECYPQHIESDLCNLREELN